MNSYVEQLEIRIERHDVVESMTFHLYTDRKIGKRGGVVVPLHESLPDVFERFRIESHDIEEVARFDCRKK